MNPVERLPDILEAVESQLTIHAAPQTDMGCRQTDQDCYASQHCRQTDVGCYYTQHNCGSRAVDVIPNVKADGIQGGRIADVLAPPKSYVVAKL